MKNESKVLKRCPACGQEMKCWDTEIEKALKSFIADAENVYHVCKAMDECVCQDWDVVHLADAAHGLILEARDSEKKMKEAMKDYRISLIRK